MSIQKPILLNLVYEHQANVSFCSNVQELCFNYSWFLTIKKNSTDGNPIVRIEVSNDSLNWLDYVCCVTGTELTDNLTGFKDKDISAKYFRLCFDPNGTTTGTLTALMNLKPR
jgi:hypothetical protein